MLTCNGCHHSSNSDDSEGRGRDIKPRKKFNGMLLCARCYRPRVIPCRAKYHDSRPQKHDCRCLENAPHWQEQHKFKDPGQTGMFAATCDDCADNWSDNAPSDNEYEMNFDLNLNPLNPPARATKGGRR